MVCAHQPGHLHPARPANRRRAQKTPPATARHQRRHPPRALSIGRHFPIRHIRATAQNLGHIRRFHRATNPTRLRTNRANHLHRPAARNAKRLAHRLQRRRQRFINDPTNRNRRTLRQSPTLRRPTKQRRRTFGVHLPAHHPANPVHRLGTQYKTRHPPTTPPPTNLFGAPNFILRTVDLLGNNGGVLFPNEVKWFYISPPTSTVSNAATLQRAINSSDQQHRPCQTRQHRNALFTVRANNIDHVQLGNIATRYLQCDQQHRPCPTWQHCNAPLIVQPTTSTASNSATLQCAIYNATNNIDRVQLGSIATRY